MDGTDSSLTPIDDFKALKAKLLAVPNVAKVVPMVCGALLCIYPYFIENLWITLVVGVVLGLVPVFLKE